MLLRRVTLLSLLFLAASLLAGCREGMPATLSGEVHFLGEPIANGALRLFPVAGTPGIGAATAIENGRYAFPASKELFAGRYRVEISATRATGRQIPETEDESSPLVDEYEMYLPGIFGSESTLTLDLAPGENKFDFHLNDEGAQQP